MTCRSPAAFAPTLEVRAVTPSARRAQDQLAVGEEPRLGVVGGQRRQQPLAGSLRAEDRCRRQKLPLQVSLANAIILPLTENDGRSLSRHSVLVVAASGQSPPARQPNWL